ncbi:MAG: ABC transporter permease, partial [Clostridiales bacterium]|nr:ABC transporter permease [Clostridiales bacterium]
VTGLAIGLGLGILLDKLIYLILLKLIDFKVALGFYISKGAIIRSLILFFAIFFLIFLNSIRQIYFSKPIELLHGGNTGEREPKSKWIVALIGVLCLGSGYYISVSINNPVDAIMFFFVAVILVVIGTYLIFTSGSIVLLKMLRKNKKYYYKTNHFISVSGMIYRMKQNAVGLGNICILVTMVLVIVSSTLSLWFGIDDMIDTICHHDIMLKTYLSDGTDMYNIVKNEIELGGYKIKGSESFSSLSMALELNKNQLIADEKDVFLYYDDADKLSSMRYVTVFNLDDYNNLSNLNETLEDNEILIHCQNKKNEYKYNDLSLYENNFKVKEKLNSFPKSALGATMSFVDNIQIVVKDKNVLDSLYQYQKNKYSDNAGEIMVYNGFNIDATDDEEITLAQKTNKILQENKENSDIIYYNFGSKVEDAGEAHALYGGFLFLGLFLGTLFTIATILIIYYKQISEGYDDKDRFEIMQKVGMSRHEIKKTIHSQILTVFFLPLITAGIHVAFAFPVITKVLEILRLTNTMVFAISTISTFVIFSIIYSIIYSLTAKTYYKIVSR